jgi:hypothetical protein
MGLFVLVFLIVLLSIPMSGGAQERHKIRISNATLSYSALALVAAREWQLFQERVFDVEIILMRSAAADGRFADRNIAYEEVAEPRFAIEVAKELGTRCRDRNGVLECRVLE